MIREWFGNVAISQNGFISEIGKKVVLSDKIDWKFIHSEFRNKIAGIAAGSETILIDNPSLLTKQNYILNGSSIHHPARIVFDRRGRVNIKFKVFHDKRAPTIWVTNSQRAIPGIHKVEYQDLNQAKTDVERILDELELNGNIMVEGGAKLLTSFINEGILRRLRVFRSKLMIEDGVKLFTDSIIRDKNCYSTKSFGSGVEEMYEFS